MSGNVYLGNNGYIPLLCISDDVAYLVLCIKPAVRRAVACRLFTVCSYGGEPGPRLYLYSPALVVGEMLVETVYIVKRNDVDIALYRIDREKVPDYIEMYSPVCEAGRIFYDT